MLPSSVSLRVDESSDKQWLSLTWLRIFDHVASWAPRDRGRFPLAASAWLPTHVLHYGRAGARQVWHRETIFLVWTDGVPKGCIERYLRSRCSSVGPVLHLCGAFCVRLQIYLVSENTSNIIKWIFQWYQNKRKRLLNCRPSWTRVSYCYECFVLYSSSCWKVPIVHPLPCSRLLAHWHCDCLHLSFCLWHSVHAKQILTFKQTVVCILYEHDIDMGSTSMFFTSNYACLRPCDYGKYV